MTTPLLATKLYAPPPSPRAVARPRLLQQLEAGLSGKLTLVCAPAGFGKSTLLGAWVQACEHPSAWLSLDEGERDVDQFVAYLTASLRSVSPDLGADALALAQARPRPAPQTVLAHLINRLAQRPGKLLLVLDDYHLASSPEVDAALAWLIDHQPAQLHLLLATREGLPLPLARLRTQGQVLELGPQALRFQADETEVLLNRTLGLGLSGPQVRALEARTEGWAAGLQMAGASLAGRADADGFIQSFSGSHRAVQDYLLEEVLLRQPAELQDLLLRCSVLDALCPELCDAVLQQPVGQRLLQDLAQRHLFVVPLDDERRWYRLHHLLAALLQQRLREQAPGAIAPLHLRASAWYEARGQARQALQHAVAAGDTACAAAVVQGGQGGQGVALYFREDAEPVLHWLQDQPPAFLDAHPPLWLMLAWACLATSQHSRMPVPLRGAEAAIARSAAHPDQALWQAELHAVSAWEAVARGDAPAIQRAATLALAGLPADQAVLRTTAHCALGVAHQFRGERAAAQRAYAEVLPMAQACGNRMFAIVASIALGHLQRDDLQLHLAARTGQRALQLLGEQPHAVACEVHLGLAHIHCEWNDLASAAHHAEHSSQLGALLECDSALGADALRARLLLYSGQTEAALALLAQAAAAAQTRNAQGGRLAIAEVQVQALLQTGQVIAAAQVAQACAPALPLAQAWVQLASGQALQAHEALRTLLDAPDSRLTPAERMRALLLQALARDALALAGSDAALALLEQAMALAEPQGCQRAFIDLGGPMERLLARAANGARPRYTAQLLAALQAQRESLAAVAAAAASAEATTTAAPSTATTAAAADAAPALAEPLSARELAVLALICKGLSNQDIARQLFVSLSTVKWHNQNIFDKLDVQRRTEAVARAQALKLL